MKKRTSNAKGTLLIAFLLFAVILGALVFRKYDTASRRKEATAQSTPAGSVVVTLFFRSADGKGLVREGREVEIEEGVEDGVESVVDELVSGPLGSPAATLPANLRVLGVRLDGGVAQIDLGGEFSEVLASGEAETAVYSIVDTVAANFPQVKAVQLLVEGAPPEKVPGKIDLSKPLVPEFELEQAAKPAAASR